MLFYLLLSFSINKDSEELYFAIDQWSEPWYCHTRSKCILIPFTETHHTHRHPPPHLKAVCTDTPDIDKHRDNNHTQNTYHTDTPMETHQIHIYPPTDITHIYTTPTSSPHIDTSYLSTYTTHTHIDTQRHTCTSVHVICLA